MPVTKFTIDLRNACPYVPSEYDERIRKALEKRELFGNNFLYTVFDRSNEKLLLKRGIYWGDEERTDSKLEEDRDYESLCISAFSDAELLWEQGEHNVRRYAKQCENPDLAIWRIECFEKEGSFKYKFKNPEKKLKALAAIARLKLAD